MKTIYTYSLPPESSLSVPAAAVTGNHLPYKTILRTAQIRRLKPQ